MIITILVVLGLCFGSFINALVWRVYKQAEYKGKKKQSESAAQKYSISKGRSMCESCGHELNARDLLPLVSWLSLRGKCRYCKQPVSVQNPIVESTVAALFVGSYILWPLELQSLAWVTFGLWLVVLVGLVALAVYDLRWMLLPNRILFPLYIPAGLYALVRILDASDIPGAAFSTLVSVLIGGGLFYVLFQISNGKWIGGGDVKIGFLLGALVGEPDLALLMLFIASLLGTLYSLPVMIKSRIKRSAKIPFGPFLIAATILVVIFGQQVIDCYLNTL